MLPAGPFSGVLVKVRRENRRKVHSAVGIFTLCAPKKVLPQKDNLFVFFVFQGAQPWGADLANMNLEIAKNVSLKKLKRSGLSFTIHSEG
jgi:hypothetical protein